MIAISQIDHLALYIGSTPPPKIPVATEGLLYREFPNVYTEN